jgi:hypothetical protein
VAKDANGSQTTSERFFKTPCHLEPGALTNVSPEDHASGVDTQANLEWGGGNSRCPGLSSTYDVYFGITSPPPLVHSGNTDKHYDPGLLINGLTYYWKIVAKDDNGEVASPVWSFQVGILPCLLPPTAACTPNPSNNATNRSRDSNLAWSCGTSQCDLSVSYDVYFGTSATLGEAQKLGTTSKKSWDLPRLNGLTKYYWKVITRDENGATSSPVWNFTTKS